MHCKSIFTEPTNQSISPEMPFEIFQLSNGIKLIHQYVDSPVAYCALLVNTGSRDEQDSESGLAHLVEHLIFKETHRRKAHHILSRLEDVGGELNAYTTKEDTCIHSVFLNKHYDRALDLISDLMFNQKITEKTLEVEKRVVIDEIKSYKDSPVDMIFDSFDELLFPKHSLGFNTLGTLQSVKKIDKKAVEEFIIRNYATNQMVLSSVGKISFRQLIGYVEKFFGNIPAKESNHHRTTPVVHPPFEKRISKKMHQSHCVLGTVCDSSSRQFRLGMTMLSNLLGGPGMNTRLNMSLRERKGWVYHVEASYTPYSDVGVFNIYFGTDRVNLEKCIREVEQELKKLKDAPLTGMQLKKMKQQVTGQLAIASDNSDARMLSAAKSLLMFNRIENMPEIFEQVNGISASYLQEIAQETFCALNYLVHQ